MNCPKSVLHDSVHARIREVDGKNITLVWVCFICNSEWWASNELKDRFGKPDQPYYDSETKSIISDSVGKEKP